MMMKQYIGLKCERIGAIRLLNNTIACSIIIKDHFYTFKIFKCILNMYEALRMYIYINDNDKHLIE